MNVKYPLFCIVWILLKYTSVIETQKGQIQPARPAFLTVQRRGRHRRGPIVHDGWLDASLNEEDNDDVKRAKPNKRKQQEISFSFKGTNFWWLVFITLN